MHFQPSKQQYYVLQDKNTVIKMVSKFIRNKSVHVPLTAISTMEFTFQNRFIRNSTGNFEYKVDFARIRSIGLLVF